MKIIDKIRSAEPAVLAENRKAIVDVVVTGGVWFLARAGVHLTPLQAILASVAAGAAALWAIPNKPKPTSGG